EGHARIVARVRTEELAAVEARYRVETSGIGQILETLAVYGREVHALHQVVYVLETAVGVALRDDALHGGFADTLHGPQTEAHVARLVGREGAHRLVDV